LAVQFYPNGVEDLQRSGWFYHFLYRNSTELGFSTPNSNELDRDRWENPANFHAY
jgi:hypothetical protein